MTIKEITSYLEKLAPLPNAEDFDNVGLLVGNNQTTVTNVLVTLDTLETTVDEAIAKKCNLIVSFHPIIFKGLTKITGKNYVEKVVIKAIQNNIAIYAMHTALDNSFEGVSAKMCAMLALKNKEILIPKKQTICKLTTYVPKENAEKLLHALYTAGAGKIGNYTECSFNFPGISTFMGNNESNPVIGEKNKLEIQKETCINVTFEKYKEAAIVKALFENHIYEEVAYEITTLNNVNQKLGLGMIGELEKSMTELEFLHHLKTVFKAKGIRHSAYTNKPIKKVAILGGSGAFAIDNAKAKGADVYVSADFKYHDFFKAEKQLLLADIGHYESEQYTKNILVDYLSKKFSNFAIILSETKTNPINYLS